ncbi:hypothetical protein Ahy_B10g104439 [Arachis hypogaea]|uniref:O-methyltransferase C-terminal domain-containing protein n=1 Tax=Arachis hypogaea TaxID=3818 RepID=A0A444X5H4_ARAHY|nr:hypothetical protein Ahy_B10g104439 [Arachis hypogaea]
MMSSSARKEEGYDDDDACMYAMLLSTFQVFPFILNAAVELNLFQILSELATNGAYSSFTAPSTLQQAGQNASFSLLNSSVVVDHGVGGKVERLYSLSHAAKYFLKNQVNIKDAIVDGGIEVFKKANGMSVWETSHTFNKAMTGISAKHTKKYLEAYDGFEGVSMQVDVGGGTGRCLKIILSKYRNIKSVCGWKDYK